jgi:hypothetical protein
MKNIIAALILGICIIIAALIHGGIYTIKYVGHYPFKFNKITGSFDLPENFSTQQFNN